MWVIFAFHLKHFSLNAFKKHFMVINFNISLKHDFVGVVWIMGHIVFETVCHGYNVWLYRLATNINWTKMKIVYLTEEKITSSCPKIEDLRKKRNQVRCKKLFKNLITKFCTKKTDKKKMATKIYHLLHFIRRNLKKILVRRNSVRNLKHWWEAVEWIQEETVKTSDMFIEWWLCGCF